MANINEMSPAARKKFGCFGVAFGSLFLLVGLFVMSVGIKNGMKQKGTSSWLSVDGVIISNNFNKRNKESKSIGPLSYKYYIDGLAYYSDRVVFVDLKNLDHSDWLQLANGLPEIKPEANDKEIKVSVYVNPANYDESVLKSGYQSISWRGVGFGAAFSGFALFWMTAWWFMSTIIPKWLENKSY